MKCKSRTVAILSVGIIAGFLFSLALQSFLLINLTPTNGWFPTAYDDYTVKGNNKRQRDLDTEWTVSSTTASNTHQQSTETDAVTSITETSQIKWQARNMQKLNTGKTHPIGRLSEELTLRQPYLIAIITSVNRLLSHTMAIHGTWAKKQLLQHKVLYFTGDVQLMPHLPHGMEVIQLEGIDDKQASWEIKEFSVIKYLTNHYTEQVDWFLVVSDQVFVNTHLLSKRLEQYRSDVPVYMGRVKRRYSSGEEDEEEEEMAANVRKCNSMVGIVYSRGLLNRMESYLPQCEGDGQTVSDCIVQRGIYCTQAKETQELFYLDNKRIIETSSLFDTKEISRAITVHPIRYPKYMYRMYSYFLESLYNSSKEISQSAIDDILITHPFIPTHLRSSYKIETDDNKQEEKENDAFLKQEQSQPKQATSSIPVKPSYKPKNKFEVNFWDYFNQTRIMSVFHEQPSHGIIGGLREEARYVLTKGIYIANQGFHSKDSLLFDKLENGYRRIDPMRGSEYVLDFVFRKNSERNVRIRKRVSVLRPFHESVVPIQTLQKTSRVHFIVTLSGLSNRLEQFLTNFEQNILMHKEDASLTIVLFKEFDDDKVHSLVNKYAKRYPSTAISILETEGEFARGVGLDYGSNKFNDNDLLFFVDVDLEVKTDFIHRCQLNTIQGKQVYFPIFFKLYNLDFVSRHYKGNESQLLSRHNGHWAHYSYGMVCIYKSDYRDSGGFNTQIHGWGEEDIDLLNRVMARNLNIFRSPDPGLVHMWHRKVCNKSNVVSSKVFQHCLQSKAENLADRTELAHYVFEKESNQGNVL